jgi:hypothetical protein
MANMLFLLNFELLRGEKTAAKMMQMMVEYIEGLFENEFPSSKFVRRVCCNCDRCLEMLKNGEKFTHWPLNDEDILDSEMGRVPISRR